MNILLNWMKMWMLKHYLLEVDSYQFEYEQNIVAEMLFIFKANDPFKLQELLDTFVLIISY